MRPLATALFTLVTAASLFGCNDGTPTSAGSTTPASTDPSRATSAAVASIAVSPSWSTLATGRTVQLRAQAYDIMGNPLTGVAFTWRSNDTTIARVTTTGLVSTLRIGRTTVTAAANGRSGYGTINVNTGAPVPAPSAAPVASVAVSPASASVAVGNTVQLTATTKDSAGNTLTGRSITWATSNAGVATVSTAGLVKGIAAGSATITATSEGRSGTSAISVTAPTTVPVATVAVTLGSATLTAGQGTQATATLRDANGNVLTGRTVTWTTSNPSVATVSASGYVTAVAAGSASIVATSEGRTGSASLSVTSPPPPPPPPSGGAVDTIYYDGFESGSLSGWQDRGNAQNQTITSTAGNVYSGSRALQVVYPAGSDGGWLTRFFMPGYDSAYVRVRIKLDANWTGGTKLMYWAGSRIDNQWSAFGKAGICPNGTDFFNAFLYGEVSPQMAMHFYSYYVGMPTSGGCYGYMGPTSNYTPDNFQLTAGVWHTIEFFIKTNTPGQANGSQQFWVDGTLRGSWSGMVFRTTTDLRVNSFTLAPNTPFTTSTQRQLWIDDVLIAKQKP